MNWNNELLEIKKSNNMFVAKKIFKELQQSISEGYEGKVFDFYITGEVGKILRSQGLNYKTYTDGEFEESQVWINTK